MLINYFKIAWRHLLKSKFHSILNIAGLFTGLAFTFLIASYVWSELQVNRTLRHADRQYLLRSLWKDPNMGNDITTLGPLAKRLQEDFPTLVANYYRWDGITSGVTKGDKSFRETIQIGDSTLLSMYGFELLHGDARTALNQPYSVVITSEAAIKYFGKTDVVGETLSIQSFSGSSHDFAVTGVLKPLPENSVTQINAGSQGNFFIPKNAYTFFGRTDPESWANIYIPSYIELQPGVSAHDLEKPIQQLIAANASDVIKQNLKVQPVALTDFYLNQNNGLVKRMLYTLSFVGLFILFMAIINFVNLSISRSSTRTREIGIRKVLGGLRKQLIFQFLTESIILVFIATALALAAYPFLRPLFDAMVGKELLHLSAFPPYFIFIPLCVVFIVGIVAGLYPAFVLSALKSVDSLKGKLTATGQNNLLRKLLVGFQFAVALVVFIAASIVAQQVAHFFSKSLGYNKEYIVSSQVPRDWSKAGVEKMEMVRNQFGAMPQISSVSLSYEIPNGNNGGDAPVYKPGTDSAKAIAMQAMLTDENYTATYGIQQKAGHFFADKGLDSSNVVLNETAVKSLGWKNAEEALGQQLRVQNDKTVYTISGVVNDFHFASMQQTISPFIIFHVRRGGAYRYLSFKLKPGNVGAAIDAVQKKWAALLPGSSFEYSFMDDTLKKLYGAELQLKKAAYTATVLSLIIALLGVLGLVSLSIQRRVKEIGVRKVLGASILSVVNLFVREFVLLVIVAGAVACPLAFLLMKGWLNNYAYRIDLTVFPFLWAVAGLGLITVLVIGLQASKAALANPVKNLRTE
jgi:putative ABC transport system permease protein